LLKEVKMAETNPLLPLEERLVRRTFDDSTLQLLEGFREIVGSPAGRSMLRAHGHDPAHVDELLSRHDRLVATLSAAIRTFADHGWAPTGRMPTDHYTQALALAQEDQSLNRAEETLVEGWEGQSSLLDFVPGQLSGFGSEDRPYNAPFRARARLVRKALEHHKAGAYEASIPLLLAHIEGITADVTGGRLFFSKSPQRMAEVVDDATIAGLHEAFPTVRAWFSKDEPLTVMTDSASRHGILHGRVLSYDTKLNSTKCIVLLLAVMEWAQPIAYAEGLRRRREREELYAGSSEVDENGRRLDDREFGETKRALQWIYTCQVGWYRNDGRYRKDLLQMLRDLTSHGLPLNHGISMHVSPEGESWWAWRRTPSGQVLGIGANSPPLTQWLYDATEPPQGGPAPGSGWGDEPFDTPPNWS
jgi:hypothetical protein